MASSTEEPKEETTDNSLSMRIVVSTVRRIWPNVKHISTADMLCRKTKFDQNPKGPNGLLILVSVL